MTKIRVVICGTVFATVMLAASVLSAADPVQGVTAPPERVVVTLSDGSRITGEMSLAALPLQSALVGEIQLPLKQILSLKFNDQPSATVLLRSGDQFEANVNLTTFNLATLAGPVSVPRKSIVEMRFGVQEAVPAVAVVAVAAPVDGLVLHFVLDDNDRTTVRDRGPSRLKGSVDGAHPHTDAYQFNGNGNSIAVPSNKNFAFTPQDPFTLAAWVQPVPRDREFQAILVAAAPNAGYEWEWGLYVDQQNHFMSGWEKNAVIVSKTTVKADRWYHVAVTYQEGGWVLYVDGVPEARTTAKRVLPTRGALAIGRKGESFPPDFFKGLIRDVRIYERALSDDEITRLYKATGAGVRPAP